MLVDPWAKIVKSATETEETIVADLGRLTNSAARVLQHFRPLTNFLFGVADIGAVQQVRDQIPVSKQRRLDIYDELAES